MKSMVLSAEILVFPLSFLIHLGRVLSSCNLAPAIALCTVSTIQKAMKTLHTEITIQAPSEAVWTVLVDTDAWPTWNPLLKSLDGTLAVGSNVSVVIELEGKRSTMKPTILNVDKQSHLRWKGSLPIPGLFSGEHVFELVATGENSTILKHYEHFKGLLVPIVWPSMGNKLRAGFESMNVALRDRVLSLQI